MSELPAKSSGRACPNFKVLVETSAYLNILYMLCKSYEEAFLPILRGRDGKVSASS